MTNRYGLCQILADQQKGLPCRPGRRLYQWLINKELLAEAQFERL